jgi:hypothetical protein
MSIHFAEVHDSNHTPEEWVISDDERRGLIK